jgi:uncharacterized SAM-dependent methyltransferase
MTFADRSPAPRARERIRDIDDFGDGLLAGLKSVPKTIPCKYFYDTAGSKLFEKISALPEYYLTRTELSLLSRHAGDIANLIGTDAEIVEFGAGASEKIRILLAHLIRPHAYMPVDIFACFAVGDFWHWRQAARRILSGFHDRQLHAGGGETIPARRGSAA